MKYAKKCPKCGSGDLIRVTNDGFPDSSSKGIMTGITILSNIPVERYICCGCGYTEEWLSHSSIEKLRTSGKAKPVY